MHVFVEYDNACRATCAVHVRKVMKQHERKSELLFDIHVTIALEKREPLCRSIRRKAKNQPRHARTGFPALCVSLMCFLRVSIGSLNHLWCFIVFGHRNYFGFGRYDVQLKIALTIEKNKPINCWQLCVIKNLRTTVG